ncbi:hypothetical protein HF086_000312 [Spodoptera exigua]|uniref:Uncharacterized protein n=1 Tax=Spodoptera exigua TaxID=7107 RepID=A0A922M840_SPOEX|nr:hypothetical protein HF086_000312 [Spodoptera exigua]
MSLQDKVAIVTGSSSGIGAAIAIKFAEEGAKVTIVGRNKEKLNNVAKKLGDHLVVTADVTKEEDAQRILKETVKKFGKLDILVNNAGIATIAKFDDENLMTVFDEIMKLNIRSVVYLTHIARPHLVETKGNVVNVSGVAGIKPFANGFLSLAVSKAALDHFTRSVALELAPNGIRVNAVSPGPVYSDIFENMGVKKEDASGFYENMRQSTALKRVSDPVEIADLVTFLASDKAKAITGTISVCDNGLLL